MFTEAFLGFNLQNNRKQGEAFKLKQYKSTNSQKNAAWSMTVLAIAVSWGSPYWISGMLERSGKGNIRLLGYTYVACLFPPLWCLASLCILNSIVVPVSVVSIISVSKVMKNAFQTSNIFS